MVTNILLIGGGILIGLAVALFGVWLWFTDVMRR